MKISRKDLRRIILESLGENRRPNLLKEGVNLAAAWRAANRAYADGSSQEDLELARKFKKALEEHEKNDSGPFRRDGGRLRQAESVLQFLKDAINSKTGSGPGDPVEKPPKPEPDPAKDGVSDADDTGIDTPPAETPETPETSDWKKYGNETGWEYQIQGASPNQIWVTRKAGGNGTEYKLNKRRYKSTVRKLDSDSNMPDRTSESIRNDPALSSAPASSASSTSGDQAADTSAVSNNENSTNEKLKKIFNAGYKLLVAIPAGKVTIYTPDGADDPGLYSVKEFDSITNLDAFYQQTSASRLANKNKGSIIYSGIDFYYNQEDKKMYFDGSALNNFSLGPYVTKNLNSGSVAYVLEGVDLDAAVDDAYVKLNIEESENQAGRTSVPTPGLRAAPPASALSEESSISENKVIYGESHATLMRKRYWGRY